MRFFHFVMKRFLIIVAMLATVNAYAQLNMTEEGRKLMLADYAITNLYVDSVDESSIVEAGIRAMIEKLDPHSSYMTPAEVKEMSENLDGNFDGIGIQFTMLRDTAYVLQTISGGPSEKCGIAAGDKIVFINDTLVAGKGMNASDIKNKLRGKRGTTVNLLVKRGGEQSLLPFKITRDQIPLYSVDAAYMVDKRIGYVKISRFAATTFEEFIEEVVRMIRFKRMKSLIIDLQGNGGGYMSAATHIANMLLDKGELIVYTEGRKSPRSEERAADRGLFRDGKLVILVDENSASASEILAGAVQDWDRGVIVGRRTFGKGLVQRPIQMPDGSMIKLTIARYYTPTGRSIQRPYDKGNKAYGMDLIERYNHGEMVSADSIRLDDSLKYYTFKNKRTVYGGGGIMPDCFIPLDTTRYSDFHRDIIAKGVLPRVATDYVEANRKTLTDTYKKEETFIEEFDVDNMLIDALCKAAEKENTAVAEEQLHRSLPLIKLQLKAMIGREIFDSSTFFKITNSANDALQRAIEIISNDEEYNSLLGVKQGK